MNICIIFIFLVGWLTVFLLLLSVLFCSLHYPQSALTVSGYLEIWPIVYAYGVK